MHVSNKICVCVILSLQPSDSNSKTITLKIAIWKRICVTKKLEASQEMLGKILIYSYIFFQKRYSLFRLATQIFGSQKMKMGTAWRVFRGPSLSTMFPNVRWVVWWVPQLATECPSTASLVNVKSPTLIWWSHVVKQIWRSIPHQTPLQQPQHPPQYQLLHPHYGGPTGQQRTTFTIQEYVCTV